MAHPAPARFLDTQIPRDPITAPITAPINPATRADPNILTTVPKMPALPTPPDAAAAVEGGKKVSRALKVTGVSIVTFLLGIAMIPSLIQGKGVLGSASDAIGIPQLAQSLMWPAIIVITILVLFYMIKSTPPMPPPRYY